MVVADACAGVDDEAHAKAPHGLDLYRPLARVTTVDELLGEGALRGRDSLPSDRVNRPGRAPARWKPVRMVRGRMGTRPGARSGPGPA
ncbi:hypothetical protein [Streptomyces griseoluteus]|uniref:hypothetical protein n=1 Tax=Streptomyces griseoluteus TaxID=29306 RepID=UPI0031342BF7